MDPNYFGKMMALLKSGAYKHPTKKDEPPRPKSNAGLAAWSAGFNDRNMRPF